MADRYAIFYFSGTGNTEFLVKLLADEFGKGGITADFLKIETLLRQKQEIDLTGYAKVGLAHPVLGFDAPGMIYDFVRRLPSAAGKPVFIVKSAADYHVINNGASKSIIKILARKGYRVFYDDMFAMPCNWLISLDDRLSRNLVEEAGIKVKETARQIMAGETKNLRIGFVLRWLMRWTGILEDKYGAKYFGQYLRTSQACTLCNKCVRNCPVSNITNAGEKITFGKQCIWCMRCIYNCPQKAIDNKYMNVFILKGGYSLKRILALEHKPIDFTAQKVAFWHKYYRGYFSRQTASA